MLIGLADAGKTTDEVDTGEDEHSAESGTRGTATAASNARQHLLRDLVMMRLVAMRSSTVRAVDRRHIVLGIIVHLRKHVSLHAYTNTNTNHTPPFGTLHRGTRQTDTAPPCSDRE